MTDHFESCWATGRAANVATLRDRLCCPRCRDSDGCGGKLHSGKVTIYARSEDNATTMTTVVTVTEPATSVPVSSAISDNPSDRRHGVAIEFECEQCGDGLRLTIAQHKGDTFVGWQTRPPSAALKPRRGKPKGRPKLQLIKGR